MRGGRGAALQRGSAMVEFGLVALAFYLLVAAIITFGQLLYSAQIAQDAARAGAREMALIPLRADITFEEALQDSDVKARVFDADLLAIDIDNIPGGLDLDSYYATLPVVNRALRPVMIFDVVDTGSGNVRLLRYPGALIVSATSPSGMTVAVPRIISRNEDGRETIEWIGAIEEVRSDRSDPTTGPFSVTSTATDRGLVAFRVNIPYQSAAMASYEAKPPGQTFEPTIQFPIIAEDSEVTEVNAPPGALVGGNSLISPVYSGPYGLGKLQTVGIEARPYRRVMTAQALFRREVFAEQSGP